MSWRALGGRWAAEVVHRVVYCTHGIIRPVSYETKCGLPPQRWADADVLTDYDSEVTCPGCIATIATGRLIHAGWRMSKCWRDGGGLTWWRDREAMR